MHGLKSPSRMYLSYVKSHMLYTHIVSCDQFPFWVRVDAIYEKVDEAYYADVTMTSSPAYEGVTIR